MGAVLGLLGQELGENLGICLYPWPLSWGAVNLGSGHGYRFSRHHDFLLLGPDPWMSQSIIPVAEMELSKVPQWPACFKGQSNLLG